MASEGLLPASLLIAPSDPVDRRDWQAMIEERIGRHVQVALTDIIDKAFTAYLDTLTAAGDEAALDAIIEDWAAYVASNLAPTLQGIYVGASVSAWMTSPFTASLPLTAFEGWGSVVNYAALDYQAAATNRLVQVGDNVWSKVNTQVLKALESGASNDELRAMIQQVTDFSAARADAITRTETISAYNNGRYDAAVTLGEYGPVAKVWDSAGGVGKRRDWHQALNNVTIPFNEYFDVDGEPMLGPHSPGASAHNVVNCACGLLELYVGDMDPDGNIWTADGPVTASEYERQEQAFILRESREALGEFYKTDVVLTDEGWRVAATP